MLFILILKIELGLSLWPIILFFVKMFSFPSLGIPRDAVLQTAASKRRGLESRGLEPNVKSGAVKWASSNQLYDSRAYVSWSRFLSGWFLFQHPPVMEGIPSHLCPCCATLSSHGSVPSSPCGTFHVASTPQQSFYHLISQVLLTVEEMYHH